MVSGAFDEILDPSALSEPDLSVLSQPFDGRLEVGERRGHDEVRARGVSVAPREWTPLREVAEFRPAGRGD